MKELNIYKKYEENVSKDERKALKCISDLASKNNIKVYLIGGIVRDIILENKGFDLDVTLEYNAIKFAKELENNYQNCSLKEIHNDFKTAKVIFDIEDKNIEIDLASTRKEHYKTPASLPTLEKHACPIKEDIIRRDFTINTLGMSLNKETFGDIVDCINGLEDLEKQELKILHKNSFIDDPTRILRMLKFSVRFEFEYEKETFLEMKKVLNSGQFDNLGTERIKLELKQTLDLNSTEGYERLINENIYKLINTDINPFIKAQDIKNSIDKYKPKNTWLVYISALLSNLKKEEIIKTAQSLNLNNFEKKVLQDTKELFENTKDLSSNYKIYKFFKGKEFEAIVAFGAQNISPVQKYLEELQFIKIKTTGNDLLNKGFKQGEEIGKALEKILEARLNDEISENQEEEFLSFLSFNS